MGHKSGGRSAKLVRVRGMGPVCWLLLGIVVYKRVKSGGVNERSTGLGRKTKERAQSKIGPY